MPFFIVSDMNTMVYYTCTMRRDAVPFDGNVGDKKTF